MTLGRRTSAAAGSLGSLLLLLTGCGEARPVEDATVGDSASASPTPETPLPAPDPSADDPLARPLPPVCREGDTVAVGRGPVDSALGTRYLTLEALNCSSRPVRLQRPVLNGTSAAGREGDLRLSPTLVADRPDEPYLLAPGASAYAGVDWRGAPLGRRVVELSVVTGAAGDDPDLLVSSELDLRLGSRLDYYPWVARPRAVFR